MSELDTIYYWEVTHVKVNGALLLHEKMFTDNIKPTHIVVEPIHYLLCSESSNNNDNKLKTNGTSPFFESKCKKHSCGH